MFTDLIEEDGQAVQANQFLIVDDDTGAIIDPGGNLAFNELFMGMSKHFPPSKLAYVIASHADPDIIASLDRWMSTTKASLVISRVWERFAPHFTKVGKTENRVIGVPDSGGHLPLGRHELVLLPAHFMHSEGNFHFYDPVSRILFTGDLGVSMTSGAEARIPVTDLAAHIPRMEGFHRRYMVSNKILRLWVHMARQLDIAMLVPQHGAPIMGKKAISDFLDWIENLMCGIDLFDDRAYQIPTAHIDPVSRQMRPRAHSRQPSPAADMMAAYTALRQSRFCPRASRRNAAPPAATAAYTVRCSACQRLPSQRPNGPLERGGCQHGSTKKARNPTRMKGRLAMSRAISARSSPMSNQL
jgi:flavorubredoxin